MSSTDNTKEPTWQDTVVEALRSHDWHYVGLGQVFVVKGSGYPDNLEPGQEPFYYVARFLNGVLLCSCRGFRFKSKCRHVKLIEEIPPVPLDNTPTKRVESPHE